MIEATVNGTTFSSLGLGVKKHDIPVLPETKDYMVEISGKDGAVDFGSVYGTRSFSVECVLMADNPTLDYHAKAALVAAAFNTKKDLILTFSDLQGRRYNARYAGTMSIEKIIFDGNLTIPFKMFNPFPESEQDTAAKEYGQGLEYGHGYEYSTQAVQVTSSSQAIPIMHDGTYTVAPFIRITGAFNNLSLFDGDVTFTFTGTNISTDVLEIDCRDIKATVKKNGLNAFAQSNGVFFLLQPGLTTFTSTSTSPNFKLEFLFRHTFLY